MKYIKIMVGSMILFLTTFSLAHAKDDLTILNTGSKTGGFSQQSLAYYTDLSRMKKDFIHFDNDKNLMDVCLNPHQSVRYYIHEFCNYDDKMYMEYMCSCQHFNDKAQPHISSYLLQGYNEKTNN